MEENEEYIVIERARTHNLKDVSVAIPRNSLTVISGVSGSGKSSLAFDTLYAEGQRRYVESLSAYARQFLGRMQKPDVDKIDGIPPAIAIEQKVTSRNPRSTVGTVTEIYEYLKLLYARVGTTVSPVSGKEVKRHTPGDVVKALMDRADGERVLLLAPIHLKAGRTLREQLKVWQSEGFARLYQTDTNEVIRIANLIQEEGDIDSQDLGSENLYLLVDRVVADGEQTTANRFADSVQTAFFEGDGSCALICRPGEADSERLDFSVRFEADGITFMEPTEHLFDFNNPLGACPRCNGYGNTIGIDPDLVVPDKSKTIYEGAIVCWRGEKMSLWNEELIMHASEFGFPIHTPYYALTPEQKQLLWTGNEYFRGLNDFFEELETKQHGKIQYRVMLARYKGKAQCPLCQGLRLRKEAGYVLFKGKAITELMTQSVNRLSEWFAGLELTEREQEATRQLLPEIRNRLQFMQDVGLGYLTLNRLSSTLSGGESQRINLAKSLGSSLVGSLYVLDEPSIGLHPRDTQRLIHVLKELRDLENTIVVVEHDDDIQRAADYSIEVGPAAGRNGGEITYTGKPRWEKFTYNVPRHRRKWNNYIEVCGATENNLKNLDVKFPLNVLTVVTGVSGSGKSSLVSKVLYPALKKYYGGTAERTGDYSMLKGSLHLIQDVEFVDQNPLSRSSRSNPVTYLKAYDEIRKLFSEQQLSRQMGFTPAHFSFNTPGGRCEECQGEGVRRVEMQFMADIVLECEHCHGKRFKPDVLEVEYRGKSIFDILQMTVDEAIAFFSEDNACKRIVQRLKPLQDVGIGYVQLGQSSSTLSGGESQRVKLASFLAETDTKARLFLFDEPTTGLHHKDVTILMQALNKLIERGHSIVVIEHNPSLILAADHVIDLGPEGGNKGGEIVCEGTPEDIMACEKSYTGEALRRIPESEKLMI